MYARPTVPLSIGGVIDDAFRLYRSSFSRWWLLSLVYATLSAAGSILILLSVPNYQSVARRGGMALYVAMMSNPIGLSINLGLILVLLVFYGAIIARQCAVARADTGFTIGQALMVAMRRIPGMLLGGILFALAVVIGAGAPIFLATFLLGRVPPLITLLLTIPGIYLWGRLQLWIAPMFADNAIALDSLDVSWRLTRGNWWRGIAIVTVMVIIMLVVSFALGMIGGIAGAVTHARLLEFQIIVQGFSAVAYFLTYPLMTAVLLVTYQDFKLRREGGDLEARLGALDRAA